MVYVKENRLLVNVRDEERERKKERERRRQVSRVTKNKNKMGEIINDRGT